MSLYRDIENYKAMKRRFDRRVYWADFRYRLTARIIKAVLTGVLCTPFGLIIWLWIELL